MSGIKPVPHETGQIVPSEHVGWGTVITRLQVAGAVPGAPWTTSV
jgi:hypothetical protein